MSGRKKDVTSRYDISSNSGVVATVESLPKPSKMKAGGRYSPLRIMFFKLLLFSAVSGRTRKGATSQDNISVQCPSEPSKKKEISTGEINSFT